MQQVTQERCLKLSVKFRLGAYAEQQGRPGPSDLGSAVALVAHLGGYRERKHDPAPGNRIMWEGSDFRTSINFEVSLFCPLGRTGKVAA